MPGQVDVAGLKPIGDFCLYQAIVVALPALFLAAWAFNAVRRGIAYRSHILRYPGHAVRVAPEGRKLSHLLVVEDLPLRCSGGFNHRPLPRPRLSGSHHQSASSDRE